MHFNKVLNEFTYNKAFFFVLFCFETVSPYKMI